MRTRAAGRCCSRWARTPQWRSPRSSAGFLGGSAVMWAEAGHSVSDTFNQAFRYTSLRRSGNSGVHRSTPATAKHFLNYAVFGLALVVEGLSRARAYQQTRQEPRARGRTVAQRIKLNPDPSVKTVVTRTASRSSGMCWVSLRQHLSRQRKQPLWDGVAALQIMGMLIFVAFALARGNKNLLIGEAVEPEEEQQIVAFLERRR
jgi:hypothetical protein